MFGQELIDEIRKSGLTGRSGSGFNTADKWHAVLNANAEKKYVIANGAEGEPDTHKDYYLLSHYPQEIIKGIILAMHTVGAMEGFLYLKASYFDRLQSKLRHLLRGLPIKLVVENPGGYRCGEETIVIQVIEGKRAEPQFKPPYPTQKGLWGYPTLIDNVETIYTVKLINDGKYKKTHYYTISGHVEHPGTFEAPENITVENLLVLTDNEPQEKTFAQVGGGASGNIVTDNTYFSCKITGTGSVSLHLLGEAPARLLKLIKFYKKESCGKCIPCREGAYRLYELITAPKINWQEIEDILDTMEKTSFCALGRSIALPARGLIKLAGEVKQTITEEEYAKNNN
ncbi:MAG: NADH-ubiquinone oxidoreductase-F iron-sulfur binding region domain-containing protein [bacterium]|nr:NADH-ubiquinone oxidoreductase-F iron-sulfur binding region domain-containing protein [bacterium]